MKIQTVALLNGPMNNLASTPKGNGRAMVGKAPVPLATFKSVDTLLSRGALCVGVVDINVPCFSNAIAAAPFVAVCAGNHRFRCAARRLIEMIEEIDPRKALARSQIFDFPSQTTQAVFTWIK